MLIISWCISFLTNITLPGMDGILLCFPITQDPSCVTLVLCQVRPTFLTFQISLVLQFIFSAVFFTVSILTVLVLHFCLLWSIFSSFFSLSNVFRVIEGHTVIADVYKWSNRLSYDSFVYVSRSDYPLAEYRHGVFYLMLVQGPEQPSVRRLSTHWCWLHLVSALSLHYLFYLCCT